MIMIWANIALLIASYIPKHVPSSYNAEIISLQQETQQISMLNKLVELKKENLRLRICADFNIKPLNCSIDWQTGEVANKNER